MSSEFRADGKIFVTVIPRTKPPDTLETQPAFLSRYAFHCELVQ